MAEITHLNRMSYGLLVPLLMDYFLLEGTSYSRAELKKLLNHDVALYEMFVLREGSQICGCVGVRLRGHGEAELGYLAVRKIHYDKGYGTLLLQHALAYCKQQQITSLFSVIPRAYELLFAQHGFVQKKDRVCMELVRQPLSQQRNLQDTFREMHEVEDIASVTATRLRKLRTS